MDDSFDYLESACLSDVGRRRERNEDACLALAEMGVFCVADGMGGAAAGDKASQAVVDALRVEFLEHDRSVPGRSFGQNVVKVCRAVGEASRWILSYARQAGVQGTGTTCVILVFGDAHPDRAMVLHAGDSRAYRWRGGQLEQLVEDHSVATELGLDDENLLPGYLRGVITRAVGTADSVHLDKRVVDVRPGDLFLLCSDGLTRMLNRQRLGDILGHSDVEDLEHVAQRLIDRANIAGGVDNITVVLVRVRNLL